MDEVFSALLRLAAWLFHMPYPMFEKMCLKIGFRPPPNIVGLSIYWSS